MRAPKYLEIAEHLRARCHDLPIGTKLPAERALAEEFGVSAMTARQALATLVDEGWVRRAAGSGTYVARPTVAMGPTLSSFTEDMERRGFTPSSTVLRAERVTPDVDMVTHLSLRPGERVLLVERLRFADTEPMCHELSIFPDRHAEHLLAQDLTGSVHALLRARGVVARATERTVRAVIARHRECDLLQLPAHSPALEITDTFFDAFGSPMQHVRSRYRFDRYEVRTNIDEGATSDLQSL